MFDNIYRAAFENLNISLRPAFNDVALYQAQRFPLSSTKVTAAAPRLHDSNPRLPVPANISNTRAPIILVPIILNRDSLTLSAVGRTSIFFGTVNFSPRAFPVIIRIQKLRICNIINITRTAKETAYEQEKIYSARITAALRLFL